MSAELVKAANALADKRTGYSYNVTDGLKYKGAPLGVMMSGTLTEIATVIEGMNAKIAIAAGLQRKADAAEKLAEALAQVEGILFELAQPRACRLERHGINATISFLRPRSCSPAPRRRGR